MAEQVLLYVKVRKGYEFIYGDRNGDSNENLLVSSLSSMPSRGDQNDETYLSAANRGEANDSEPAVAHIHEEKTADGTNEVETTDKPGESDTATSAGDELDRYDCLISSANFCKTDDRSCRDLEISLRTFDQGKTIRCC